MTRRQWGRMTIGAICVVPFRGEREVKRLRDWIKSGVRAGEGSWDCLTQGAKKPCSRGGKIVFERGKRRDLAFCRAPDTQLLQNALPREPFRTRRLYSSDRARQACPSAKTSEGRTSEGPACQVRMLEVGRGLLLHTEWVLSAFTGRRNS